MTPPADDRATLARVLDLLEKPRTIGDVPALIAALRESLGVDDNLAKAKAELDRVFQRSVSGGDATTDSMVAPDIAYIARLWREALDREAEAVARARREVIEECAAGDSCYHVVASKALAALRARGGA
jgi:hypothetical protein